MSSSAEEPANSNQKLREFLPNYFSGPNTKSTPLRKATLVTPFF